MFPPYFSGEGPVFLLQVQLDGGLDLGPAGSVVNSDSPRPFPADVRGLSSEQAQGQGEEKYRESVKSGHRVKPIVQYKRDCGPGGAQRNSAGEDAG